MVFSRRLLLARLSSISLIARTTSIHPAQRRGGESNPAAKPFSHAKIWWLNQNVILGRMFCSLTVLGRSSDMKDCNAMNNKDLDGSLSSRDLSGDKQYDLRILRSIRKIIQAVDIHSRKLNHDFRITTPQLICLHSLSRNGSMTLSQLARDVSLGTSTTTGILDRLESKGLITRTRSTSDRRKVALEITSSGKALIQATPSLLQDRFAAALSELPELEQTAITLSLERVVGLMGGEHLDSSPNLISGGNLQGATTGNGTKKD